MSTQISERTEGSVAGGAPLFDEIEDRSLGAIDERLEAADERFYYANPWKLIMWRFQRHRLAMFSLFVLVALYLCAIFAEFVSPYSATTRMAGMQMAPPSTIHIFHE
ncbi:MAG: hypothetical protein ACK4SA_14965, partial [Caldilinea sp.]